MFESPRARFFLVENWYARSSRSSPSTVLKRFGRRSTRWRFAIFIRPSHLTAYDTVNDVNRTPDGINTGEIRHPAVLHPINCFIDTALSGVRERRDMMSRSMGWVLVQ